MPAAAKSEGAPSSTLAHIFAAIYFNWLIVVFTFACTEAGSGA